MPLPNSKFQENLQADILAQLNIKPCTLPYLSDYLGANYHSVRKAISIMHDLGLVKQVFNGKAKNIKWTVGEDPAVNNSIPVILHSNKKRKNVRLKIDQLMRIKESTDTVKAINELPRHVINLFAISEEADLGENVTSRLAALKSRIEGDLETIDNLASLYRQLLSNPNNWNPEVMRRYIKDTELNLGYYHEQKKLQFPEDN